MLLALATCLLVMLAALEVLAVPPAACFARFRHEDCGGRPRPVLYYWPAGSRCEVGVWRGCLPSPNMFRDEYECVTTCVFSARARAGDYHAANEVFVDEYSSQESETPEPDNATDGGNHTAADGYQTEGTTPAPDTTETEGRSQPTGGADPTVATTPSGGGDQAATTQPPSPEE